MNSRNYSRGFLAADHTIGNVSVTQHVSKYFMQKAIVLSNLKSNLFIYVDFCLFIWFCLVVIVVVVVFNVIYTAFFILILCISGGVCIVTLSFSIPNFLPRNES